MKKISIIIPVYNVEKHIEDCIKSILAQTYINFEAIFVNDGSPDNSASIIEEYAKKDHRVILKNIPNGGVTNARHEGVKIATGDFVMFVDSDDELAPKALETKTCFNMDEIDIILNGRVFRKHSSNSFTEQNYAYDETIITGSDLIKGVLSSKYFGCITGHIFKRDLFYNEEVIDRYFKYGEDFMMLISLSLKANQVVVTNNVEYIYQLRGCSCINSFITSGEYENRFHEKLELIFGEKYTEYQECHSALKKESLIKGLLKDLLYKKKVNKAIFNSLKKIKSPLSLKIRMYYILLLIGVHFV